MEKDRNVLLIHNDTKDLNKIRIMNGLEPIKAGARQCLSCERRFFSSNLKQQKICGHCRSLTREDGLI